MRLPLVSPVDSRDGQSTKDGRQYNVLIERDGQAYSRTTRKQEDVLIAAVRPGLSTFCSTGTAVTGQGITQLDGTLLAVYSGKVYFPVSGTMGTGVSMTIETDETLDMIQSTL